MIGFIIGMFVGAFLGIIIMSICKVSSENANKNFESEVIWAISNKKGEYIGNSRDNPNIFDFCKEQVRKGIVPDDEYYFHEYNWTTELLRKMETDNITLKMLAEQLGKSEKYVSRVFNGQGNYQYSGPVERTFFNAYYQLIAQQNAKFDKVVMSTE